jgi:uncharacterized membrane protein YagU involved in acid resistance
MQEVAPISRWTPRHAVLVGAVGGAGDILFAICFAAFNGTPPQALLQTVASGLLGKASYDGGPTTAALGLLLHFLMAFAFAAVYVAASRRFKFLTQQPVIAGAVFGVLVFFFMRLVVLPLSAFPYPVHFRPLATVLDLASHMFLFGLPIALSARKAAAASGP